MITLTISLNDIEHNDGKMINICNVVTRITIVISVKIIAIRFVFSKAAQIYSKE